MDIGGPAAQPQGQAEFCAQLDSDTRWSILCDYTHDGPLTLLDWTAETEDKVGNINTLYNTMTAAINDRDHYGQYDFWVPAIRVGDCEDIAMAKKLALHNELGIPMHQISIATAWTPDDEGHAVLLLHTTAGVKVLDNLTDDIMRWDATPLRFSAREHRRGNQGWVHIHDRLQM